MTVRNPTRHRRRWPSSAARVVVTFGCLVAAGTCATTAADGWMAVWRQEDAAIVARVSEALHRDPTLYEAHIGVTANGGVVRLSASLPRQTTCTRCRTERERCPVRFASSTASSSSTGAECVNHAVGARVTRPTRSFLRAGSGHRALSTRPLRCENPRALSLRPSRDENCPPFTPRPIRWPDRRRN